MSRIIRANYRLTNGATAQPLPVFTWRISANYAVGGSRLASDVIIALNTAFSTEGVWWAPNFFSGAPPYALELKRINSPDPGEMTTARMLFFGGTSSTPAVAALDGDTRVTTTVFQTLNINANTGPGGPPTLYTAGDPYGGGNGNLKGVSLHAVAVAGLAAGAVVWFAECSEGVFINITRDAPGVSNRSIFGFVGRFWDDLSGTPKWINFGGLTSMATATYPTGVGAEGLGWAIPGCTVAPSLNLPRAIAGTSGSSTIYDIGRIHDQFLCSEATGKICMRDTLPGGGGYLMDVMLGYRVRASGNPYTFAGRLRQIKYGPSMRAKYQTLDGVTQMTRFMGVDQNATNPGIHLDQSA